MRPEIVGGAFDGATARKPIAAQLETAPPLIIIIHRSDANKFSARTLSIVMAWFFLIWRGAA